MLVASTAMAKDLWEVQINTSPTGKLGDHKKLIKSILKENVSGYDGYEIKENSKTLIVTFDYDRTSPKEIVNVLNEKDPTLKASISLSVQPISLALVKSLEKFEKAKKKRTDKVEDLKNSCKDYDKAHEALMEEIKRAEKHGYEQRTDIVKTVITITEE